jgi:hypothetical protein
VPYAASTSLVSCSGVWTALLCSADVTNISVTWTYTSMDDRHKKHMSPVTWPYTSTDDRHKKHITSPVTWTYTSREDRHKMHITWTYTSSDERHTYWQVSKSEWYVTVLFNNSVSAAYTRMGDKIILQRHLINQPTSCSTVLLEKLRVTQPVKKFPSFYGTRRFIAVFTIIHHWSLSWARWIRYTTSHLISLR